MTRPLLSLLVCAAIGAGVAGSAPRAASVDAAAQDAQQPTFRSGASAVVVDVTVRDRSRRPIANLKAADFEVYDDGVLQQVDDVTYGKLPIDVAVALDVSHSVTGQLLDRLRQGVVQLMRDLGQDDRLKLVLFNTRVRRIVDYARDVNAVEAAIRDAAAGGGTSLFDALSVTLVSAAAPDRRQLIVVFTDGSDSSSTTTPATAADVALRTRATLAFVMPSAAPVRVTDSRGRLRVLPGSARGSDQTWFQTLARDTGGSVLPVGAGANLPAAFRRVLNEFRSAYVLHYTARGVDAGGFHGIRVRVKREGAEVQARRGYFGS